jgi:hypothetical protein
MKETCLMMLAVKDLFGPYQTVSLLSVSGLVGLSGLHCQKNENQFPGCFG